MATRTLSHLSSPQGLLFRLVPGVVVGHVAEMMRARETRRMLATMDARTLSDIGLSQGAASYEANRPFWDIEQLR